MKGGVVLDPFVGVGTTLDACVELGRRGVGIELNPEFADIARTDLSGTGSRSQRILVGDSRVELKRLRANSVDFVMTSPPYGALLKNVKGAFAYKWQEHSRIDSIPNPTPYSDHPADLGNMEYAEFLDAVSECLLELRRVQKPNSYAVWVLKDFRAVREGIPYVNLHGHFIERAELAGFRLWDLRMDDQTTFRPLGMSLGTPRGTST